MIWLYSLLIPAVLIAIILFGNIKTFIKAEGSSFSVLVYFSGILVYDSRKEKKEKKPEKKKSPMKKEEPKKSPKEQLEGSLEALKPMLELLTDIGKAFRGKIICEKFYLDITFGLEDAAAVGILTGFAWSVVGLFYGALDSYIKIQDPVINVNPVFNRDFFHFQYEGIYQIKLNHIIYVFLKSSKKLFKIIKQLKKGGV